MRTRVKICGITRPDDAKKAIELGADAIGLVFYPPSPRAVTIDQAYEITKCLPPFVSVVGLFVNAESSQIEKTIDSVPLSLLQFHGDESPEACAEHQRPYMKAIRMREGVDLAQTASQYQDATGLLLDSYQPGVPGGTGLTFDWSEIPQRLDKPIVLAGGLNAENVGEAIATTRPYAVDVSGGVELAKGVKSAEKMAAFISEVKRTDERL